MTGAPPKAVIFDWDNTLVDSWQTIHDALNETLAAMGQPLWTLDQTKARARHSLRDSFPTLFGDDWDLARQHYLTAFEAIHLDRLRAFAGAEAMLEALHGAGIHLALVSNKTGRILRREVASLGWDRYFGMVVGAGDAAFDKPHRAPVDLALEGSGIAPGEDVWFVGDTATDLECARNAECVPVLFLPGGTVDPSEFALLPPDRRFIEFPELRAAILPS